MALRLRKSTISIAIKALFIKETESLREFSKDLNREGSVLTAL